MMIIRVDPTIKTYLTQFLSPTMKSYTAEKRIKIASPVIIQIGTPKTFLSFLLFFILLAIVTFS